MKYVYKHLTEKAIWFFIEYICNSVGYIEFIEKKKSKFLIYIKSTYVYMKYYYSI